MGLAASWLAGPVELGVVRTVLFGGEGRPYPESASDWSEVLLARDEHTWGRGLDTDQLMSICGRLSLPEVRKLGTSLEYLGLYVEYGAESAMNGQPASIAHVFGVELDFGRTDARLEYAETENPSPWYEHYVYKSGYTYRGRVIGHHIGCCSRGGELRIDRYLSDSLVVRIRSEAKRYERRDLVVTDVLQGAGLWGVWHRLRFSGELAAGRRIERARSKPESIRWYAACSLQLGLSLP